MRPTAAALILPLLLLAACERPARDAAPERTDAQVEAARRACIARELVAISEDEIEMLEATLGGGGEDPAAQFTRQAQMAALEFARVLHQQASLRLGALAHADSAVNHAARSADSARHMQMASRYIVRPTERGTVEANALAEYERRFAQLLADEDHRCNWDV